MEDLRLDLLPKIRIMAQNHAGGLHPWPTVDNLEPKFVEGDVFRIIVPLDEAYSFDYGQTESATNPVTNATNLILTEEEQKILFILKESPTITQKDISERTGISLGTVKRILPKLQEKGALVRIGNRRSGIWQI